MTSDEALKRMQAIRARPRNHHPYLSDEVANHIDADAVLCDLLRSLGFDDLIDEYDRVDKWYE